MAWRKEKLGDVCTVERGSSPRPIKKFLTDDDRGVNWIKIGDTKNVNKYIFFTEQKITIEGAEKSKKVEPGDFILSNSMSYGRPYIMKTSGYIHDGWFVLRLHDQIDPEFFYHLLTSSLVQSQFKKLAAGAIVKNISSDLVKKTILLIPPLDEQKRIVAILDQAFEGIDKAIANTEQNLKNARELFDSLLEALFTPDNGEWETTTIGNVGEVFDGPHATPKTVEKGPVFLGISSLQDGELILEKTRHVTPEDFLKWTKRVQPRHKDIVFSYETRLGQAAMIPEGLECCLGRRMGLVRLDQNKVDPLFFMFMYISPPFRKYLESRTNKGATVDRIPLKQFPHFPIHLPRLAKQKEIAAHMLEDRQMTRELEAMYLTKLEKLKNLKQSLLQKAFSGELTNTDRQEAAKVA